MSLSRITSRVFLVLFFILLVFSIIGFSVNYIGGLIFAFLAVVVLIPTIILATKKTQKTSLSSISSQEKTYPKGYDGNQAKETKSPRREHSILGMGKSKKIGLGIIIAITGFFVLGFVSNALTDEETKQRWAEEIELEKKQEQQKIQEQKRLEELKTQEEARIAQMTELPASCYGVASTETWLYPTGEECIKAIGDRINEYCLSETNGNKAQADACVTKVISLMDRNCQDSDDQGFLSVSYEVCMMSELTFAYQNLIPQQKIQEQKLLEEQKRKDAAAFDPTIVQAAKKNLPEIQSLPKEIINQCRKVNSYSDFITLGLSIELIQDELTQTIEGTSLILTELELHGYDEHTEVGPMIRETRNLYSEALQCLDKLVMLYGE